MIAIVAVVAGIAAFIASNETAKRIISDVWNGIKSFISTAIGSILGFYADMADRISKIGLLPDAVQRKMASLSKSLRAGSKSVLDWGKKTKQAKEEVIPAIKETKKFAEVFNAPRVGLNPVIEEADKKAEALKKQQDKLRQSFADTLNPSQKLGEKLKVLVDEFDREDVVKAHWEQILKARDASVEHKTALDPLVTSLVDEATALEEAKTKADNLAKSIRDGLKAELEEAKTKTDNLAKAIAKEDGLKAAFAATINPSATLGTKLGLLMNEFDRETLIKAHATEIVAAATASKTYKTALDPLVTSMVAEATAIKSIDENLKSVDKTVVESTAAQDMAAQWNTAMGTLSADISKSIVGIFTGDGSALGKLGNAFKRVW